MAKDKPVFLCDPQSNGCGAEFSRKLIKCPRCGVMGSMTEYTPAATTASAGLKTSGATAPTKPTKTIDELSKTPFDRTATGIGELDRVLGGGFVAGSVVLLGGAPGSGKSTISMSTADRFAARGETILYASGEESEPQIGLRAQRMGVTNPNIKIVHETNLESLLGHIQQVKPTFVIVDSLQAIASSALESAVGSVSQSLQAAQALTRIAKSENITMLLINQVTKDTTFAGSNQVLHLVDVGMILESDEDTPLKFMRCTKNRFGDTTEVGVFQHTEQGLAEVADPSGVFLESTEDDTDLSGASISFMSEGVRQIPVEIQALVSDSHLPTPRKQFSGVLHNRGQIVCAILDKFLKTHLYESDVFINTVSGVRVDDPLADLSIAASIASSHWNKPVAGRTAFVGELSLTGQVRGSFMVEAKIREADRLGFERIVIPQSAYKQLQQKKRDIKVQPISSIKDLRNVVLNA